MFINPCFCLISEYEVSYKNLMSLYESLFAIKFNRVGSAYVYKDYGRTEVTSSVNAVNAGNATLSTNDILEIKLTKGDIYYEKLFEN